jgi:Tol biopolymer transport system component
MGGFGGRPNADGPTPEPRPTAPPAAREWLLPGAPGTVAFGRLGQRGFDVWSAALDGAEARRMTNDERSYAPAWSSDGVRIAVTREEGGRQNIYVGDANTSAATRVDLGELEARYPAWSPDGGRLAVAARRDSGQPWRLAIVDLASGAVTIPQAPASVGGVAWAPGRFVAFAAPPAADQPQDIFVLDADGAARNITDTPEVEEDLPAWSHEGRKLAFAASPWTNNATEAEAIANLAQRQIFATNADGSGRTQLTSGPGPHTNPAWSPDGAWIAYVARENSADWQVWAMRSDGGEPRQITFGAERKFYLSWGP